MSLPKGRALRDVFGDVVTELAATDPRIVMLDGDLGSSTRGQVFENAYPERYFQMGIAEQNMLGVAAGMAKMGCIPFISTFVAFALHRPLDQIRVLIAQTGANVKITAGYTGLFTGRAGKTHQVVDDISIARAMPGLVVISPADEVETREVLTWSVAYDGPVFIRLVRDVTQTLFAPGHRFQFGKVKVVREGADITLISTGHPDATRRGCRRVLAAAGIEAHVVHVPTTQARRRGRPRGRGRAHRPGGHRRGAQRHRRPGRCRGRDPVRASPTRVDRIGIQDHYTESASDDELLDMYCLSAERVAQRVRKLLASEGPVSSCT